LETKVRLLFPDIRYAKSTPFSSEAAGRFQESAVPLTLILLENVLDKHKVIPADRQTTSSKTSSGNIYMLEEGMFRRLGGANFFGAQIGIK